jgi:hypothetical protein
MTTWTLDRVCQLTRKPAVLNALHACREGHPLNKTEPRPWLNAWFLASAQPSYVIPADACDWLKEQADAHGEAFP